MDCWCYNQIASESRRILPPSLVSVNAMFDTVAFLSQCLLCHHVDLYSIVLLVFYIFYDIVDMIRILLYCWYATYSMVLLVYYVFCGIIGMLCILWYS